MAFPSFLFDVDLVPVFPELYVSLVTLGLLLAGVLWSTASAQCYPRVLATVTALALWALGWTLLLVLHSPLEGATVLHGSLLVDGPSQWAKAVVVVTAATVLLLSLVYHAHQRLQAFELVILVLLATLSAMVLVSAQDFLVLYLGIELQSLSFYVLAALKRHSEYATEAGLKYFLLGAFASGLVLFGCSILYGLTGTVHLGDLSLLLAEAPLTPSPGVLLGMLFLLAGFLFKVAAAPFHMWSPDVYEGAPTSMTLYFMAVPKVAFLVVLARLYGGVFLPWVAQWQPYLLGASALSLVVGALGALAQGKIKRLLAYGAVGHMGFLLGGLACGTLEGLQALLIYLVLYVVMTLGVFAVLLASPRVFLGDFRALGTQEPMVALGMTLLVLSMAGIPPLGGFYGKAQIFLATLGASLVPLAVLGVLTSVVSCFYYLRLVKLMYFDSGAHGHRGAQGFPLAHAYVLALSVMAMVLCMVYPSPLALATAKVSLLLTA